MAIFHSARRIQFGPPLAAPNDLRPREALFVRGNAPKGFPFCVTWTYDKGAVGYHLFRSQSIRHIRDRSMHSLWSGSYGESVAHFVIGEKVDTVIDNYRLQGANLMFYWVLSQDSAGNLRPVENLQVRMADDFARARKHIVLEFVPSAPQPPSFSSPPPPSAPVEEPMTPTVPINPRDIAPSSPRMVPTIPTENASWHHGAPSPRPAPRPPTNAIIQPPRRAPQKVLRQVYFVTYQAPGLFQISKEGQAADQYQIFIGPQIPPTADLADAMWDGTLMAGNPMRCYTLPGHVDGFRDVFSKEGETTYMAVFAIMADGSRSQPSILIPTTPPASLAELT